MKEKLEEAYKIQKSLSKTVELYKTMLDHFSSLEDEVPDGIKEMLMERLLDYGKKLKESDKESITELVSIAETATYGCLKMALDKLSPPHLRSK